MRRDSRQWLRRGVFAAVALCAGCGHILRQAPNHPGQPFDFENPPCTVAGRPPVPKDAEVEVRYLGAGGLYLRWGEDSILLGPYFSNPGVLRVLLGRWRVDDRAIEHGLAGIPVREVEAIFAGHSHYDHIGDLPVVLKLAPRARVFVNRSGVHALAPYGAGRLTALEDGAGQWVWLTGETGERRPVRFFAVPSDHAPQVAHFLWAGEGLQEDWREPWGSRRFHELRAGETFALVLDLLSSDRKRVLYRLYYQDSANRQGLGEPPPFTGTDRHPYDLAVLCVASYDKAAGQPSAILKVLQPRHVLVTHYEDFLQKQDRPVRFVPLLTEGKVESYLRTICRELGCDATPTSSSDTGPVPPVCGPSGPRWTVPLPGEWLRFLVQGEASR